MFLQSTANFPNTKLLRYRINCQEKAQYLYIYSYIISLTEPSLMKLLASQGFQFITIFSLCLVLFIFDNQRLRAL